MTIFTMVDQLLLLISGKHMKPGSEIKRVSGMEAPGDGTRETQHRENVTVMRLRAGC